MAKARATAASKTLPAQADHIVERVVDGELVLYDPKRQCVHALNPTASFIWCNCDGKQSQEVVVATLADRYPHNLLPEIERDVQETVSKFLDEGLVKP